MLYYYCSVAVLAIKTTWSSTSIADSFLEMLVITQYIHDVHDVCIIVAV
jgi:hypothetical protein